MSNKIRDELIENLIEDNPIRIVVIAYANGIEFCKKGADSIENAVDLLGDVDDEYRSLINSMAEGRSE